MTGKGETIFAGESAGDGIEPISVRIPDACRLTGIGRSKLYELIASGDLEVVKIGAMTLVPFESLRHLIKRARRADSSQVEQ